MRLKHISVCHSLRWLLACALLTLPACASLTITQAAIEVAKQDNWQRFVDGTEDLPLYRGFKPYGGDVNVYKTSEGRIVSATYFKLNTTALDVEKFYALTMPQLGWRRIEPNVFVREEEKLHMTMSEEEGGLIIHFALHPIRDED